MIPQNIEEANEIYNMIREDVERIKEKYFGEAEWEKLKTFLKKYLRKKGVEEDLKTLAGYYNEIKNLASSYVVLEEVRNVEPGKRKDTVFAKLLHLRSYVWDLLIELEKNRLK